MIKRLDMRGLTAAKKSPYMGIEEAMRVAATHFLSNQDQDADVVQAALLVIFIDARKRRRPPKEGAKP